MHNLFFGDFVFRNNKMLQDVPGFFDLGHLLRMGSQPGTPEPVRFRIRGFYPGTKEFVHDKIIDCKMYVVLHGSGEWYTLIEITANDFSSFFLHFF
jgi:hypothetical protein